MPLPSCSKSRPVFSYQTHPCIIAKVILVNARPRRTAKYRQTPIASFIWKYVQTDSRSPLLCTLLLSWCFTFTQTGWLNPCTARFFSRGALRSHKLDGLTPSLHASSLVVLYVHTSWVPVAYPLHCTLLLSWCFTFTQTGWLNPFTARFFSRGALRSHKLDGLTPSLHASSLVVLYVHTNWMA